MANPRYSPNELCWCGSGKKFKRCHYGREANSQLPLSEIHDGFKMAKSVKRCLHWDASESVCSGSPIAAHSLQRRGVLSQIAKDNEVCVFDERVTKIVKGKSLGVKLENISTASTFYGFCSFHDNETFKPLETMPFTCTKEQVSLLAYRAACKETLGRDINLNLVPLLRKGDRGKTETEQSNLQHYLDSHEHSLEVGSSDADRHKSDIETIITSRNYSEIHGCVVYTDAGFPALYCAGWLPECDFAGNALQRNVLYNPKGIPEVIWISALPAKNSTALVFSWCGVAPVANQFMDSLLALPNSEQADACLRFVIEFIPDCCISPVWWDGLTESEQGAILLRRTTAASPQAERSAECLVDDGLRIAGVSVVEITHF